MPEEETRNLAPVSVHSELVQAPGADDLLGQIRPEWQAKNLIKRVNKLLPVDPSSACQRLLNAAIHDLRHKIVVAGIDLAKEAANRYDLPSVAKTEDVLENYSTFRIIDLAYRIGILSRPEWRRIKRCYEIRRDLEHEDDEYEAQVEDVLYIFKSSVEIVLSKDPIQLLRVSDVKELIDAPQKAIPSDQLLSEYEQAPDPRQREILEHLINTALNPNNADVIRQNSMEFLRSFRHPTKNPVKIELGKLLQERAGKKTFDLLLAKVAHAAGVLPYLKQRQLSSLFDSFLERLTNVGYRWQQFAEHRPILDDLEDTGGLNTCHGKVHAKVRRELVLWMTLCYLGEPGGYGTYGLNRKVFYSNVAAPVIARMFQSAGALLQDDLVAAAKNRRVKTAVKNKFIARRLEKLRDYISDRSED